MIIIGCICGGWIEVTLLFIGLGWLSKKLKRKEKKAIRTIEKKLTDCDCECHEEDK